MLSMWKCSSVSDGTGEDMTSSAWRAVMVKERWRRAATIGSVAAAFLIGWACW